MAFVHAQARLVPSKAELVQAWLPSRLWGADAGEVTPLAAYRFDDPAGEVGLEAILFRSQAGVLHVPLTYRAAPLEGAERSLVGTMEHSELGRRWAYDGAGDPVWVTALAAAVLAGAPQAVVEFEVDGRRQVREPALRITGSGTAAAAPTVGAVEELSVRDEAEHTVVTAGPLELVIARVVGTVVGTEETLTGAWDGGQGFLAGATLR